MTLEIFKVYKSEIFKPKAKQGTQIPADARMVEKVMN